MSMTSGAWQHGLRRLRTLGLAGGLDMDAGQLAWLTGMMLRLGELLIGQANPQVLAEIEKLPHQPGERWQREMRLVGFSEGQITAELARRWNFPMQIVQALERTYDPLVEQAFSGWAQSSIWQVCWPMCQRRTRWQLTPCPTM
jgi:hypothetical protein